MPKHYGKSKRRSTSLSRSSKRKRYSKPQRAIGINPGVYNFKRSIVYEVDIKNNLGMPDSIETVDGKAIVWNYVVGLDSLPNYTEFENLFEMYRLTGAVLKFYPAWNDTNSSGAANILMRTKLQRDGRALTAAATEEEWLEMQATKTRVMPTTARRPIRQYMRLTQLSKVYSGVASGTEDYTVVSPKFISTSEHSCPHYGMQFRFDTMGGALSTLPGNSGKFKMEVCVYFQCKSVK